MICKECLCERKDCDFFGRGSCYKCQYKAKSKLPKVKPIVICRMCGNKFEKGMRWVYCSWECQQKAEGLQKKDYWTNHVN